MAQVGYTPISLYYSATPSATPSAGNLANGELALNVSDGKLYYKDNGGVVQLLATKAGASGDVVGPGSSTDNALVRFDGTTGKLVQNSAGVLDDSGNLTGIAALTTSGALTLNGGTANGVAYLNGSKVLTTGSALTYNGSTLSIAGTAATTSQVLNSTGSTTGATYGRWFNTGSDLVWGIESSAGGALATGGSAYAAVLYTNSAVPLQFGTAGTVKATLDASGNLGLGVTPSAWNSGAKALQLGTTGSFWGVGGQSRIGNNHYYDAGGTFRYLTTGIATDFSQTISGFFWNIAASGTAGNAISFTQAMTLDSSGNLLVGTTNSNPIGSNIAGVVTSPTGNVSISRDGAPSLDLNRYTSDGTISRFYRSATQVGSISVTTVLTTYNTTSDYRLKNVIGAVSGAGERLDALEPVEYTWKADGSHTRGFLAHKFQDVYPNSVTGIKDAVDKNGKPIYQGMQAGTSEVIADLVAEIQSLRKRLAAAGIA